MTKETKKCPNCGHEFKKGEEYCPNCDLFVPINEQHESENTFDPHATKQFKAFNEKDIEKQTTEAFNEPTFKHRNKTAEEKVSSEAEKKDITEHEPVEEAKIDEVKVNESSTPNDVEKNHPTETSVVEIIEDEFSEIVKKTSSEQLPKPVVTEEKTPESTEPSTKSKKKKTRAIIGMSAAVVLIVGGVAFYSAQQKKADEKAITELVSTADYSLNTLYNNSEHVFLKDPISTKDITKAKQALDKLKGKPEYKNLKKEFDQIEEKFNKQSAINDLFKSPIIEGDKVNTTAFVKNADHIPINKISTEKDGFDTHYNKAFAEAEKQKKLLTEANDALNVVFKENEVNKSANKEQVETANKAIKEVSDPEPKKELQEKLDKVRNYLDKTEKEQAQAQAEKDEQARLEQEKNKQNTQNNNKINKDTNSSNRWGNRQDSSINYSDDAWGWNQGVQEKVISEVVNRGYVVDGGYSLVPKYVENGEGFYDLYATTNSKLFPKSKPEEFPIYVVTINAKTGWFKGNGPN